MMSSSPVVSRWGRSNAGSICCCGGGEHLLGFLSSYPTAWLIPNNCLLVSTSARSKSLLSMREKSQDVGSRVSTAGTNLCVAFEIQNNFLGIFSGNPKEMVCLWVNEFIYE